ncbi:hypothetical protein DFP72DRAFT_1098932 [Ephemerocybe angulata]|uniref:Uncharacterized protein n=1 Tax=Ephemerocybe angulata TaxID=980116 RepID=A0A8H6I8J1_9AGAR|nr:hypothetical protein DFP72DRAFT_1098932 [Tulosesus angulatus]
MPEAPEIFSFLKKVDRVIEKERKIQGCDNPQARLILFPRVFAVGTKKKAYCSIFHDASRFNQALEPASTVVPSVCSIRDLQSARTRKRNCITLTDRILSPGPLLSAIRGKCLVLAAGHHAVTVSFGLEACIYVLSTSDFYAVLEGDSPGPNPDGEKAKLLRTFKLPPHLIVPGSVAGGVGHSVNIFCAFLMESHVVIVTDFSRLVRLNVTSKTAKWTADDLAVGTTWWNDVLWKKFPDGPDWVLETESAYKALDEWRASELANPATSGTIVEVITTNESAAFGGFGRHLANDFLYSIAIHPGLSAYHVCHDEEMWKRLRGSIHQYMAQWHSKEFISRCLNDVNSVNPFAFNHVSDWNYLSLYTKVYYKKSARTRTNLFNLYQQLGYLDPDNIVSTSTKPGMAIAELELDVGGYRDLDVHMVRLSSNEKAFTVIVAQPPEGHSWSILPDSSWTDIQGKGNTTTVGPASFREGVQNKVHPDSDVLKPKAGRPAKLKTGKRGRPPTSKSVAKYANKIAKKTAFSRDRKGSDISVLGEGSEGEAEQHEVRPISSMLSPIKTRAGRKRSL